MSDNYVSQEISKTIKFDKGIVSGGNLESLQAVYPLKEADFLRLRMKDSKLKTLSGYILGGVIGYVLNIFKNIVDYFVHKNVSAVQNAEWVTIVAGLLISLVLYLCGEYLPNERSKIMKAIEKYFSDHCKK